MLPRPRCPGNTAEPAERGRRNGRLAAVPKAGAKAKAAGKAKAAPAAPRGKGKGKGKGKADNKADD